MIYANRATDAGDFFQSMGRYMGEEIRNPAVVKEIFPLLQKYDTPALYRRFGKKKYKDEREFLQKAEDSYIREEIRPYIELQVAHVIDMLADSGCPLFLKGSRLDNFYKEQRIFLQPVPLRALLRFERTEEFTRYILRLTDDKCVFYPADYDLKVLTRKPCRVLSGRRLFRFPGDFDGQRLLPFLQKREILIPKANEQLYFRKFILKNVRHEEIEVQGFEVIVKEVDKKAFLSLERDVFGGPVLVPVFYYGSQWIPVWSDRKALVELHTDGENYAFHKVNRDFGWENILQKQLSGLGLRNLPDGGFQVNGIPEIFVNGEKGQGEPEEKMRCEVWVKTIGWLRQHRTDLQHLGLEIMQKSLCKAYYISGWDMEMAVSEKTDWFELNAVVVLEDGRRIPLIRFREHILSGQKEFILEDGTIFLIPEEWFASYTEILLFAGSRGDSLFLHRSQYMLLDKDYCLAGEGGKQEALAVDLPCGLRAEMRYYQQVGYRWLYTLYNRGLGGCLADDMGLGKTLQVIALLLKYRQETVKSVVGRKRPVRDGQLTLFDDIEIEGREENTEGRPEFDTCLIVVPASLIHNWKNELRKFAPQLTVTIYAGCNREDLRPYLQRSDVVIVTYHTLRNDIRYLSRLSFGIIVADEAQSIKNPGSQLYQAMLCIRGKHFFALTGTPVENSLTDLWAIMNLVNRNMLGTSRFFQVHFIRPVVADNKGKMGIVLQRLIAPYLLRRTREEVLSELPELTSELVVCEPDEEQRRFYEEEQAKVRNYILGNRDTQKSLRYDFMVLKALVRLRQIANHPRLVEADYTGDSGKFREIFRMLEGVVNSGHKVLVFSSFVKYLNMVADEIVRRDWKYAMLTGATVDREQEVRRFTGDSECRIFLISLKAGGVGLNLTEAGYVFILDPWWNLAAENQAIGRAYRMGQKQAVFVYRFVTAGTLEEKILAIQRGKQQLAEIVLTTPVQVPFSDEELLEALKG